MYRWLTARKQPKQRNTETNIKIKKIRVNTIFYHIDFIMPSLIGYREKMCDYKIPLQKWRLRLIGFYGNHYSTANTVLVLSVCLHCVIVLYAIKDQFKPAVMCCCFLKFRFNLKLQAYWHEKIVNNIKYENAKSVQ